MSIGNYSINSVSSSSPGGANLWRFFDWLGNRRPSQPAKGLAALEDLDGFADLPAAVTRDGQSMVAFHKGD